ETLPPHEASSTSKSRTDGATQFQEDLLSLTFEQYPNTNGNLAGIGVRENWDIFLARLASPKVITVTAESLSSPAKINAAKKTLPLLRFVTGGGDAPSRAKG